MDMRNLLGFIVDLDWKGKCFSFLQIKTWTVVIIHRKNVSAGAKGRMAQECCVCLADFLPFENPS